MSKNFKINTKNIEKLFAIAKNDGVSAASILENLQFSPSALSEWKKGKSCPTVEALMDMANYFNVTVDYLLCRESSDEKANMKKAPTKKRSDYRVVEDFNEIPYSNNPREMVKYTIPHDVYDKQKNFYGHIELQVNSQCPICHTHSNHDFVDFRLAQEKSFDYIGIFHCRHCHHTFTTLYKDVKFKAYKMLDYSAQIEMPTVDSAYTPYQPPMPKVPEVFDNKNFSKFKEAYNDIALAESFGINGLVGIAYRRAVDFLVRDFFIYKKFPQTKTIPQEEWLSTLIKALPDDRIKAFAASSNILANDYTHYVDHHTDKDINEIKRLFDMLLRRIEEELRYGDTLTVSGIEKYNLPTQTINLEVSKKDKKAIATEFAKTYENLIQDKSFRDITKLYNAYNEDFRAIILEVLIKWIDKSVRTSYSKYPLPKDILGY